jgi:multidrug efflux pump subunit AcrB
MTFMRLPTSFLPDEDQGTLMTQVKLPASATDEQLQQTMKSFEAYLAAQSGGQPLHHAQRPERRPGHRQRLHHAEGLERARRQGCRTPPRWRAASRRRSSARAGNASVFVMLPPAVRGLGSNAGFDVQLQDLGGIGHEALVKAREQFLALARKDPALSQVRSNNLDDTPQFAIDIDDRKAAALSLDYRRHQRHAVQRDGRQLRERLRQQRGRVKKVYVQADAPFRMQPEQRLTAGTCATATARWCRSRPSPAAAGPTARRSCRATTACRRSSSSAIRPRA